MRYRVLLFSMILIFNACANYMGTNVNVNIMKPVEIVLFIGVTIGQVAYVEDFFDDPSKLNLLQNYKLISTELVKMLDNFKSNIRFGYYHNSKEKEWVDISLPPNLDWKQFNFKKE